MNMPKPKPHKRAEPKVPIILPDGRALMLLGIVADQQCSCVHMLPATIRLLKLNPGDFIQIDNDERCTTIVRQIASCPHMCCGMRGNYLYVDSMSAHYLTGEVHDTLRVGPAIWPLECP